MTGAGHSTGSDGTVSRWARQYRADARSDSYRAALRTLSLGHDQPTVAQARRAIRENTELVALAASFKWLDNPAADAAVLRVRQTYDARASPCRYLVLFLEYDNSTRWLLLDDLRTAGFVGLTHQAAAGCLDLLATTMASSSSRSKCGKRRRSAD